MAERRRFIVENGDEQYLVVVEHVNGDEYRDVAFLSTREGWTFEQVQAMAREIVAVPELIAALEAEEKVAEHGRTCPVCTDASIPEEDVQCQTFTSLYEYAADLRDAAIHKAKRA